MATKTPKLAKASIPSDLDPLAAVALAALAKPSDEQRDGLSAGTHPVDMTMTLRVAGELRIGAATTTVQVNKLKPWHLARLFAQRLPPAIVQEVLDLAVAAAKDERASEVMEAESDELKVRAEALFQQAGLTIVQERRGNVAFYGTVAAEVEE